jgi:hypothetical protein
MHQISGEDANCLYYIFSFIQYVYVVKSANMAIAFYVPPIHLIIMEKKSHNTFIYDIKTCKKLSKRSINKQMKIE